MLNGKLENILQKIKILENVTQVPRTLLAVCPNSFAVIKAALRSAKRLDAPMLFAATLNQVDIDKGYTGMTQKSFVEIIKNEAASINFQGPLIIGMDHGGPWQKDIHVIKKWPYDDTMAWVKKSYEAAIEAGYDLLHIDPTKDITLNKNERIKIETVVERTIELIAHVEKFRINNNFPEISYEVGTEEIHGGLSDINLFRKFLNLLKDGLSKNDLSYVFPCFVVGQVGTDLHTTLFDFYTAKALAVESRKFGSLIKGHYTDNVSNPEEYPKASMGGANVGPEFAEKEYEGLMQLLNLEKNLYNMGMINSLSDLKEILWKTVIDSYRWIKWLLENEKNKNFEDISTKRQEWLVKTGCRYVWANHLVLNARKKLFKNLDDNGISAETIVLLSIESSIDKYLYKFNLAGLNSFL